MRKHIIQGIKFIFIIGICFFCIGGYKTDEQKEYVLQLDYKGEMDEDTIQLFFDAEGTQQWSEEGSQKFKVKKADEWLRVSVELPKNIKYLRIDFDSDKKTESALKYAVRNIAFTNKEMKILDVEEVLEYTKFKNQLQLSENLDSYLDVTSQGEDPYIILDVSNIYQQVNTLKDTAYLYYFLIAFVIWIFLRNVNVSPKNIKSVFHELKKNNDLIVKLGFNDFKTKYASSYLGIIWGFINPMISILVYWFVFQVAFKSGDVNGNPFILWFLCGIVPWFFFSEALNAATNSFIEYSYLVKKVKFQIDILPFIKIISSLFVHIFFVAFVFIMMAIYGKYPNIYNLQVFYYIFCMIILVYAITIFTSSVVLFFRDLGQIISIILNVGFWFTPIGWNLSIIPSQFQIFLKMNPMYYIVQGFRDSFVESNFIWQRPYQTIYFWFFIVIMFSIGITIFRKLRAHFADVL